MKKESNHPTKIALNIRPKDKIILPKGGEARVMEAYAETVRYGKYSDELVFFVVNTRTKKNIRVFYYWNDEVKLPLKPEPKYKWSWLAAKLERWIKKLEIVPTW